MLNTHILYCPEFLEKTKSLPSIEQTCYYVLLRHIYQFKVVPKDELAVAKILNGKSSGPNDPFSMSIEDVRVVMAAITKHLPLQYPEHFPECISRKI